MEHTPIVIVTLSVITPRSPHKFRTITADRTLKVLACCHIKTNIWSINRHITALIELLFS